MALIQPSTNNQIERSSRGITFEKNVKLPEGNSAIELPKPAGKLLYDIIQGDVFVSNGTSWSRVASGDDSTTTGTYSLYEGGSGGTVADTGTYTLSRSGNNVTLSLSAASVTFGVPAIAAIQLPSFPAEYRPIADSYTDLRVTNNAKNVPGSIIVPTDPADAFIPLEWYDGFGEAYVTLFSGDVAIPSTFANWSVV